ncbi:MAG: dihydroorotase [Acidimicrobiales bacterium]
MSDVLVRGGLVVGVDGAERADVLVRDGVLADRGPSLDAPVGARVVDAADCWVGPGFVDLHTHLREPGGEAAETIESGARAAAIGGYSLIVAMANTEPAIDSAALVEYVLSRGSRARVEVAVMGAITVGRRGESLAPMAEMAALGVRLFSDDGIGVQDPAVMRRALLYASALGVRLAEHCEDERLVAGGSMNEGALSSRLGLVGRPAMAEELMVLRDIELARWTGAAIHFLHLSTARSLAMVAAARREGLDVTSEVAPHHFTLDESACVDFDPLFKVNPPLRRAEDAAALREALVRGEVDAVATDHAPHPPESKDLPFDEAPAGVLGLEHAASLTYEALGSQQCDPRRFFDLLSRGPARVARVRPEDPRPRHGGHGGALRLGDDANVVVFDPGARWVVDRDQLHGRSRNTPYHGRAMHGRVRATIARGVLVADDGELT